MKKYYLIAAAILISALALVWSGRPDKITNYPSSGTDIIAFGDSLVYGVGSSRGGGFVRMLSEDLGIPIANLGVSGDTTGDALKRVSQLDRYKPKVVMVLLGGNDYLLNVPREKTLENLGKIIDEIHKRGAVALILDLDDGFGDLAEEKKAAYISEMYKGIFGREKFMSDTLHPNDQGYRVMADRIRPVLKDLIPQSVY